MLSILNSSSNYYKFIIHDMIPKTIHFLCSHHKLTKQVTKQCVVYKMIRSPLYYCRRSMKIYRILGFPLKPTDESFFQLKYNKHLEVFKAVSIQLLAAFFNYSVFISAVFDLGFVAYFCSDGMRKTLVCP